MLIFEAERAEKNYLRGRIIIYNMRIITNMLRSIISIISLSSSLVITSHELKREMSYNIMIYGHGFRGIRQAVGGSARQSATYTHGYNRKYSKELLGITKELLGIILIIIVTIVTIVIIFF